MGSCRKLESISCPTIGAKKLLSNLDAAALNDDSLTHPISHFRGRIDNFDDLHAIRDKLTDLQQLHLFVRHGHELSEPEASRIVTTILERSQATLTHLTLVDVYDLDLEQALPRSLITLSLNYCELDDDACSSLANAPCAHRSLAHLDISFNEQVSRVGVMRLARRLSSLRVIDIYDVLDANAMCVLLLQSLSYFPQLIKLQADGPTDGAVCCALRSKRKTAFDICNTGESLPEFKMC